MTPDALRNRARAWLADCPHIIYDHDRVASNVPISPLPALVDDLTELLHAVRSEAIDEAFAVVEDDRSRYVVRSEMYARLSVTLDSIRALVKP